MKVFFHRILFAILLVIPLLMTASASATIHGVVYEWNTFQPMENVIVSVNSTPVQSMVCKYGTYSFELPVGSYKIIAHYYGNSNLIYYGEDLVNITDEGSYVLDLLLFPVYSQNLSFNNVSSFNNISSSINLSSSNNVSALSSSNESKVAQNVTSGNTFIPVDTFLIIILISLVLFIWLRHPANQKNPPHIEKHPAAKQEKVEGKVVLTPGKADFSASAETIELVAEASDNIGSEELYEACDSKELIVVESEDLGSTNLDDILKRPIPPDLQEIIDVIHSQGGRMTQKDLRGKLKYSEGKVSLMLFDLEKRGLIQKFKRGRGNVIILVEQDQSS